MNPTPSQIEWRKKWSHDLRTTDAPQGLSLLKSETGAYCCLGRLCDISGLGSFINLSTGLGCVFALDGRSCRAQDRHYPPADVKDLVGMDSLTTTEFSEANDSTHISFGQIADAIDLFINDDWCSFETRNRLRQHFRNVTGRPLPNDVPPPLETHP